MQVMTRSQAGSPRSRRKFREGKVSPTEASAPTESPEPTAGSSGAVLPTETTHQGEQVLGTAHKILVCIHTIHLQAMHKMGSVWELDRTLTRTLMAEFTRLQMIVGEDLTKSLIALHADLETSCEGLMSDFARTLGLHPDDPVSHQVKAIIQKFQESTSLKMNLPLMELEADREDMEGFLWHCLDEIRSQSESRELIKELSRKLSAHANRVQEDVQAPKLNERAMFQ